MRLKRILVIGVLIEGLAICAMAATTHVLRPSCEAGAQSYLLAANAGAIIRVDQEDPAADGSAVVIFRPRKETGWASQRLLARFDLDVELNNRPVTIRNTGIICRGNRH